MFRQGRKRRITRNILAALGTLAALAIGCFADLALNLLGTVVIVATMYLFGCSMWDIDLHTMPDWAATGR